MVVSFRQNVLAPCTTSKSSQADDDPADAEA